jgi:general secretion pathway protein D
MPQVVRRDVITNVKVYDGDTIVLGGMLTENSSGNDDRMPGVGNVPLAGFLGRVQTSFNDKRNLLIFVTARIVNPDGLPVRRASQNGLFDFRR